MKNELAVVKQEAAQETTKASSALAELRGITIASSEDLEFVAEVVQEAKGENSRLEEMKKRVTGPMMLALEEVRSWFRPAQEHYAKIESMGKVKMQIYHDTLDRQRREALQEAETAAQEGTRAEVESAIERVVATEQPITKGVSYRQVWKFEIQYASKVPREFCSVDEKKIRAYVQEHKDKAVIDGVRIYPETLVASAKK